MTNEPGTSKAMDLISAIVAGDAEIQDGIAELKKEGISSLEEALATLKKESNGGGLTEVMRPVDFRQLRRKSSPEVISEIVQVTPEVPFILHGTWYEPNDITRFNGQELHFISSPNSDHMLVVDDRDLIVDWWQFSYFERYREGARLPEDATDLVEGSTRAVLYGTSFYEHDDFGGDSLWVNKNRGYSRLSTVGFNDSISSFAMIRVGVAELHEHKNYQGQSFSRVVPSGTLYTEVPSLRPFGWNDRASAVGTW